MALTHCDPCLKIQFPSCQETIHFPIGWTGAPYTMIIENATGNTFTYNGSGLQLTLEPLVLPAGWYDPSQTLRITLYDDTGAPAEFTYNGHQYGCIWLTFSQYSGGTEPVVVVITDENGNTLLTENDDTIIP